MYPCVLCDGTVTPFNSNLAHIFGTPFVYASADDTNKHVRSYGTIAVSLISVRTIDLVSTASFVPVLYNSAHTEPAVNNLDQKVRRDKYTVERALCLAAISRTSVGSLNARNGFFFSCDRITNV